jgi:hypothetical protein
MLKFREYFNEEKVLLDEQVTHELVGKKAEEIENKNKELLGRKKSSATREFPGEKIDFGKKNGEKFISHGKHIHKSVEDIVKAHGENSQKTKDLTDLFNHMDKILPRTGGHFVASFHRFSKGKDGHHSSPEGIHIDGGSSHGEKAKSSKFSLVLYGKRGLDGNIKNFDTDKLSDHPDVHIIPSKIKEFNPSSYTPEEQADFSKNMLHAKASYSKLEPDVFERLGKHTEEIQRFVNSRNNNNPPKYDEYIEWLKETHKPNKSLNTKSNDRVSRRLNDLLSGIKKSEMNNLLAFNFHITKANDVISNSVNNQANSDGVYGHKGIK